MPDLSTGAAEKSNPAHDGHELHLPRNQKIRRATCWCPRWYPQSRFRCVYRARTPATGAEGGPYLGN